MILPIASIWIIAAGTLWAHALFGIPGGYLGQGYPLYPGLTVSPGSLALDAAIATLPIALLAALARHFRLRWLVLPLLIALWLWAAAGVIQPFAIDFGTTWTATEPLVALFLHPVQTPLALALFIATAAWCLIPRRTA